LYTFNLPLSGAAGIPIGIFTVAIANAEADSIISSITLEMILAGIIGFALVVAITLLVVTRLVKPIELMASALDDIASGDGDLTLRLPDSGKDEIGKASKYFNRTIEKIRGLVLGIKEQAGELSDIGNDLASNMTQTASAMDEIAANIRSIKGRVISQSASVTQTNATMEHVTNNINKLSDQVETQSGAVFKTSSAIEEMLASIQSVTATLIKNSRNVEDLKASSEAGRSGLMDVSRDIQEIARESEDLLEINSVMENIASQTNLLSMNAAIEAAHAGEAGKGFAVVADEIRKLAESSGEQSKTISAVLKKISESIKKIKLSAEDVLLKFEAIDGSVRTVADQEDAIRRAMEEQAQGSRDVLSASARVSDITREVKGGSQEMLEGSKEVIEESRNLERATQEIANGINEMSGGADEINRALSCVNELSGRNRESISVLMRAISQFKV
ncbi:MAG: methyl-accepting chemotaxis protein, partial [Treponema sp.]|nr:methyl-accepting chemotaxis protein [Treponema sp.]